MNLDDLDTIISKQSKLNNDIMDSDELKMVEKIMEARPVVTIPKSKQNKLNKIVKVNRYKFWQGKNELNVARAEVGFKPIKLQIKQCLSCMVNFESEGSHNRICQICRKEQGHHD